MPGKPSNRLCEAPLDHAGRRLLALLLSTLLLLAVGCQTKLKEFTIEVDPPELDVFGMEGEAVVVAPTTRVAYNREIPTTLEITISVSGPLGWISEEQVVSEPCDGEGCIDQFTFSSTSSSATYTFDIDEDAYEFVGDQYLDLYAVQTTQTITIDCSAGGGGEILFRAGVDGAFVEAGYSTDEETTRTDRRMVTCEPADPDNDGDGYPDSVDCDDNNPDINPGMEEDCENEVDDNCNGYLDCLDEDCDGDPACEPPVDEDNDGYSVENDCDDNNPDVNPGADEDCDNKIDDDCDTDIDCNDDDCTFDPACDPTSVVPTVVGPQSIFVSDLFGGSPLIYISGQSGVLGHDPADGTLIHGAFPFFDVWGAVPVDTMGFPYLCGVGPGGLMFSEFDPSTGFNATVSVFGYNDPTDGVLFADSLGGYGHRVLVSDNVYSDIDWYYFANATFEEDTTLDDANFAAGDGNAYSAWVDPQYNGGLAITNDGAGNSGSLMHWVPETKATATLVGPVGDDPRRLRCADVAATTLCVVTNHGSNTITVIDWPVPAQAPSIAGTIGVGDGPVGVDLQVDGNELLVLTTGYNDDSFTVTRLDDAGAPVSSNSSTLSNCYGPRHAVFYAGAVDEIIATCHLDDTYVQFPAP